jgi:hypothetical protein
MATYSPGLAKQFQDYLGPGYGGGTETFSPYGSASQAQAFNFAGGANTQQISDLINSITRGAQTQALQARIPGGPALEEQSSANIGSELRGELPADVLRQLQQQSAERGVATGSPGSPNTNAAYLRALGLTSLDLTGRGQSQLTAAEGRNPAAPIYDPSAQLITPYQGAQLGAEQTRLNQEYQMERDRLAQERNRLAQQYAFSGRGGGGGGSAPDPSAYVRGPWASDVGNPPALLSPYATTGATGDLLGTSTGTYGMPQAGGGTYSATDQFGNPVANAPGGTMNAALASDQMFAEMFPGAS